MITLEELINRGKMPERRKEGATVSSIKMNFLEMLKKRPIDQISVADLCMRCNINRSTFYRHYSDLYALLASVIQEAHSTLFYEIIDDVDLQEDFELVGYQYILKVLEATEKRKSLYKLLLFGKTPTTLQEQMCDSAYQLYLLAHEGPSNYKPGQYAHLHYRFFVNGMIGVWAAWVKEDCATPKEAIAQAIRQEISGFYNNMYLLYGKAPPSATRANPS